MRAMNQPQQPSKLAHLLKVTPSREPLITSEQILAQFEGSARQRQAMGEVVHHPKPSKLAHLLKVTPSREPLITSEQIRAQFEGSARQRAAMGQVVHHPMPRK